MLENSFFNNITKTDILPPLHVSKSVKESDKWQMAIMDSFETIAIQQFQENMKYADIYRMIDGKMSYQELKDAIPHLGSYQEMLDGVGIPTFLKHYDILGILINSIVNKWTDMQDKFHVTDVGEIADNEFLRFRDQQIQKVIKEALENEINLHLAEQGLNPEGQQFENEQEQQAFIQQVQQARQQFTPEATLKSAEKSYKTIGVQWGEATLDKDKEEFSLDLLNTASIKDALATGKWFREYKIGYDKYYPKNWSPLNTFHSKEIDGKLPQDGQYIGRFHLYTPSELLKEYGHQISAEDQKKILGGRKDWKSFIGVQGWASGSIMTSLENNFGETQRVPFSNYFDYQFGLGIEDFTGIPMSTQTIVHADGRHTTHDRFLPRFLGDTGRFNEYARVLRDDIENHRNDLCQVTEVYFIAYKKFGYLTYENEFGRIVTEEVTEDILPEFIKENEIKVSYKEKLTSIIENFEPNTLQWTYVQTTFEGLKIQSPYLDKPLYVYCKEMDHQIKGTSEFDRLLPVSGFIGKPIAPKILPFQAGYNLCMNQMWNLLEKELGMFILFDVSMIPSEWQGQGNAEDAFENMRNTIKDLGFLPRGATPNGDTNPISVYDISFTKQISDRIRLAEFFQSKAYEQIGINPAQLAQPSQYSTAEGVKVSQEVSWQQLNSIFQDFNFGLKNSLQMHLSVAQYAQSNKKDLSINYTKSDASRAFLQISDPEFALRNFGLIASADNKKRKDLETFKSILINNNTLGSDTLELAKLVTSDSYAELVEIAKLEREHKMQRDQETIQRQEQMVESQNQNAMAMQQLSEQKEDERQNREIQKDIIVAQIQAAGRAADKESDPVAFNFINQAADRAIKEMGITQKVEQQAKDFQLREKQHNDSMELKKQQLELKAKEIEQRKINNNSENFRSVINKN